MQNIYPADSLCIADLAQVDLRGFQILVPQDYFRHHFQGHTVSTGIGDANLSDGFLSLISCCIIALLVFACASTISVAITATNLVIEYISLNGALALEYSSNPNLHRHGISLIHQSSMITAVIKPAGFNILHSAIS